LNAIYLVSNTKSLIQELRDSGWDALLEKGTSFFNKEAIQIPDMSASFFSHNSISLSKGLCDS